MSWQYIGQTDNSENVFINFDDNRIAFDEEEIPSIDAHQQDFYDMPELISILQDNRVSLS